jgi:hypothetical protein
MAIRHSDQSKAHREKCLIIGAEAACVRLAIGFRIVVFSRKTAR